MSRQDSREEEPEQARYVVSALRRGLAVLNMFRRDRRIVSVPEIAAELDLSRATAFRMAYTLERDGYLVRVPNSFAFRLGPKVLLLGFDYLHTTEVVQCGREPLNALRDRTGFSTHMGVRDGTDVVYVLKASSHHRLRGDIPVGTRYPCHAVATGWALLIDIGAGELADLYRDVAMTRFTEQTPTSVDALAARLGEARELGYVTFLSGFVNGIASVSAPIRDGNGAVVAAINISDSDTVVTELDRATREVLRAAAEVSRQLGWRG